MLSNGVHPKFASERLGHSKVGITLDLYGHALPGLQEDAAARVDEALREAVQNRTAKHLGSKSDRKRLFRRVANSLNAFNGLEGWPSGLRHRS
jgi:hypothetical protein